MYTYRQYVGFEIKNLGLQGEIDVWKSNRIILQEMGREGGGGKNLQGCKSNEKVKEKKNVKIIIYL